MRTAFALCTILLASPFSRAGEVPVEMQAKFVKIAAGNAIACKDGAMAKLLQASGVTISPDADFAYAASEAEVKAYFAAKKLVLCPRAEWLSSGATIAIIEDGGRPNILLNMRNMKESKAKVSDSILKVAKQL